jgi:hypothetical protein
MNAGYWVKLLVQEFTRDGGLDLRRHGFSVLERPLEGSYPTFPEAIGILGHGKHWQVEGKVSRDGSGWSICVKAGKRYALLVADMRVRGSGPGVPAFTCCEGWPCLLVEVLEKLASSCGAFVVISADSVAVVRPGTLPGQAWRPVVRVDEVP